MKKNILKQEYLLKKIIKQGAEPDGSCITEAYFVIETKEGLTLYCNADNYFSKNKFFVSEITEHEGRKILTQLTIMNFSPIIKKSKNSDKPFLKVVKGNSYYSFFGKIISIEKTEQHYEGKTIHGADATVDCGTEFMLPLGPKGLKEGFTIGDYFLTEGEIYLFDIEFLEETNEK